MTLLLTMLEWLVTIQLHKLYCTSKETAYGQIDQPSILLSTCLANYQQETKPMAVKKLSIWNLVMTLNYYDANVTSCTTKQALNL